MNLVRPSYSCRSSLKRKISNAAYTAKKKQLKSITQSLNDFQRESAFSNSKLCVMCKQFYLSSAVSELTSCNSLYVQLELEKNMHLKRMQKFWLCHVCQSSEKKLETMLAKPKMKKIEIEGWQVLYPTLDENLEEELNLSSGNTPILVPCTGYKCGNDTHYLVPNLYSNSDPNNSFISTLYHNRLTKFALRKLYSDFYDGEIATEGNKKLESISKIYDESVIRSSSSWTQKQKKAIVSQFAQYGGAAIAFSLEVGVSSIESVMTSLLCEGSVITVEFQGNIHDEFISTYYSHNHGNNTLCSTSDCVKTEIQNVPHDLEAKCLPNFIMSLAQKQSLFIEHFVKSQNFQLSGEDYFCGIEFGLNGTGRIIGLIWTRNCNSFNEDLSQSSLDGRELNPEKYLQYLESNILTTVNHIVIQEALEVAEDEAQKISQLATMYQVEMNMPEQYVPLPSYETLLRCTPGIDGILNMINKKRLLQKFKTLLLNLTLDEKTHLSTQDWLTGLMPLAKFEYKEAESKLMIDFQDLNATFIIDTKLNKYIEKYGPLIGEC